MMGPMPVSSKQSDAVETIRLDVTPEGAGVRLDAFIAARLEGVSRTRVQALIRDGRVTDAGGTIGDGGRRVKLGETFEVELPPPEAPEPVGEDIPLKIVFEDKHLIVIDKPAGLVVHPAAGHDHGTLVNALIAHCGDSLSGIGGVRRPGIVHRLDKDTSGLIVVAKTDAAHQGLSEQFAAHGRDGRMQRAYLALIWGKLDRVKGTIDAPLARSQRDRKKIVVVRHSEARHAVTHYEVLKVFRGGGEKPLASLVRLVLETGRTHQIRVHMAHIGHPVLADQVYASGFKSSLGRLTAEVKGAVEKLGRQALHASELGFAHPVSGKPMHFESPLPPDLALVVDLLSRDG